MPHTPDPTASIPDVHATQTRSKHPHITATGSETHSLMSVSAGNRYLLGEEIARGGMGEVYRATDTVMNREVAVKVLQSKYDPESGTARRFFDEAQITGQLQHPAIPPVHDLGTLPDGRPFLAMKLIKGQTLDELLKARAHPSEDRGRFIAVFEAICQGVAYAHAHDVLHRDLKPHNVMVGSFGEVQVMDWGLAKVLTPTSMAEQATEVDATSAGTEIKSMRDSDDLLTQAGSVLGTPAYMPPEQAIGAVDQINRRSDVFGLGGILTAILTGLPPFVTETAESTRQLAARGKVQDCFARLDASAADPEWIALAKRCLSPEPEDRLADAGEVAVAVANLRLAAEERARKAELDRATASVKLEEASKRRRVQRALAVAIGVLILVGVGGAWYANQQAQGEWLRRGQTSVAIAGLLDRASEALAAENPDLATTFLNDAARRAKEAGITEHAERIAGYRADRNMLRALAEVDSFRWTVQDSRLPPAEEIAEKWAVVFRDYGIVPGQTAPDEAARRVNDSAIRTPLLTALDGWLASNSSAELRNFLVTIDPHPFREAVRTALAARDQAAATRLAESPEWADQPPGLVQAISRSRLLPKEQAGILLQNAVRYRPGDFGLLMQLGSTYKINTSESAEARPRWYQAALALRPTNLVARVHLGIALSDKGDLDGAIAEWGEAIRLDPKDANAHNNLGVALSAKGDLDGATAAYREAIRLDPKNAKAHINLGYVLRYKGDLEGALAACREAIRLDPKDPIAHNNLGSALRDKGDLDGALTAYREAIRLNPKIKDAQNNLIRAERIRNLMARLEAVLVGRDHPTPTELCELAYLCGQPFQKRYKDAFRLYERAFANDPKLAEDLTATNRYNAACGAILSARGEGVAAPTDRVERAAIRGKALAWLRADLASWQKLTHSSNPGDRQRAIFILSHWLRDPDLMTVRPGIARIGMPESEIASWDKLWKDAHATLKSAQKPAPVSTSKP